jgi:hypothetical protein
MLRTAIRSPRRRAAELIAAPKSKRLGSLEVDDKRNFRNLLHREIGRLTQIAFDMTGTRWSGPRFFGLCREKPA